MPSSNDPSQQGSPSRPEDNPFVAFRRFADAQVSSMLNMVFTLPGALAHRTIAELANIQCTLGPRDSEDCEQLRQLEKEQMRKYLEKDELSYQIGRASCRERVF